MKYINFLLLFSAVALHAGDWQIDNDAQNKVIFHSSSTLIDFDGATNQIDGYIYWDGKKLFSGKNAFYFEVRLESFETGNGKRDRDMRDDVLQTDQYPLGSFKGSITSFSKVKDSIRVMVTGNMKLHGKQKQLEMPATIILKNGVMRVLASFSLFLHDYNIKAPQLIAFVKVADEIKLELDFKLKEYKD